MSGFSIPAPFPRLAGLAASGRLPQSLLLSGPSGAPTVEAAIALSAIVNSSDRDPESEATRVLHQRIVGTDSAFRTGGEAGRGTGPAGGPYPDVRILRPERGKPIRVDEVRQAIAAVRTHPFEGRRRVLVIEAADTMNPPAANALLKTLEEPHAWLGLILCATREAALLPTIVSRCQRWRFAAPTTPEVAARLQEAHDYPPEEAVVAAAAARGDLARALALPRDRLLPLAEDAERMAAIVGRGIAPPARTALTERLMKASPRSRKPGHIDELQTVLVLLRATLRDLAAFVPRARRSPAMPDTSGRSPNSRPGAPSPRRCSSSRRPTATCTAPTATSGCSSTRSCSPSTRSPGPSSSPGAAPSGLRGASSRW